MHWTVLNVRFLGLLVYCNHPALFKILYMCAGKEKCMKNKYMKYNSVPL